MSDQPPIAQIASVPIEGETSRFFVRRIYCIGRNYAEHAKEMQAESSADDPFFFMKPSDAIVADGAPVHFPAGTSNLHHEIELVVAIGSAGERIRAAEAVNYILGYAVGNDLTRRDLQLSARDRGRPWEAGKAFDGSAPIGKLSPVAKIGHPKAGRIWLKVNDSPRQDADLSELLWPVPRIIEYLSGLCRLMPGDLIFTGTPAGVGPLERGDVITGGVDGLCELRTEIL